VWSTLTARPKALNAVAVTPSDAEDINPTAGVYLGVGGDLVVTLGEMEDGESVKFVDLAAGIIHPLVVKRIWDDETTADDILAVY